MTVGYATDTCPQPVFFCRDPIQGPDVIRSQYRRPDNFLLDYNATFDLLGNTPEGYASVPESVQRSMLTQHTAITPD